MASSAVNEVALYIDGFNLYNGLKDKHGRKYLWLDLESVARRLLRPDQQLALVRYFTAPVRNDPPAQRRQATYLGALRAATAVDVVLGDSRRSTSPATAAGISGESTKRRRRM